MQKKILNSEDDLFIFGCTQSKNLQFFRDPIIKAFSDGKISWLEFCHETESKIREFNHPLEAFHEILGIQRSEKLHLAVALSYEFGGLFEEIKSHSYSEYELPVYSIYAFVEESENEMCDELYSPESLIVQENKIDFKELAKYSTWKQEDYQNAIEKIKKLIKDGETYQVNLSQNFKLKLDVSPINFFKNLINFHPSPYSCFMQVSSRKLGLNSTIVSNSPELFLEKTLKKIITRPIKGTRMRGGSEVEDDRLVEELLTSGKDNSELSMIVDLERNDLSRVSEIGTVKVNYHAKHEKYSNVHHLVSEVEGELLPNLDLLDVLRRTFPCGSISGAPKIAAQKIIADLEHSRRNIFSGGLGIVYPNGNFRLNVAIRTGVIENETLYFNAGGGIVYDSDPESEYIETLVKARAFFETWQAQKVRYPY